jgi:hypothetical protein
MPRDGVQYEGFAASSAALDPNGKNPDAVREYFQGQVAAIEAQFMSVATKKRLIEAGLSPALADAGLEADQVSLLIADAVPKLEAKRAAAANVLAEKP